MLLFMTAVFMVNNYAGVLALLLFTLAVMKGSGIPLRYFIRAVKPLMFLLVFIFLFHLFYGAGGLSCWMWGHSSCMPADWRKASCPLRACCCS